MHNRPITAETLNTAQHLALKKKKKILVNIIVDEGLIVQTVHLLWKYYKTTNPFAALRKSY